MNWEPKNDINGLWVCRKVSFNFENAFFFRFVLFVCVCVRVFYIVLYTPERRYSEKIKKKNKQKINEKSRIKNTLNKQYNTQRTDWKRRKRSTIFMACISWYTFFASCMLKMPGFFPSLSILLLAHFEIYLLLLPKSYLKQNEHFYESKVAFSFFSLLVLHITWLFSHSMFIVSHVDAFFSYFMATERKKKWTLISSMPLNQYQLILNWMIYKLRCSHLEIDFMGGGGFIFYYFFQLLFFIDWRLFFALIYRLHRPFRSKKKETILKYYCWQRMNIFSLELIKKNFTRMMVMTMGFHFAIVDKTCFFSCVYVHSVPCKQWTIRIERMNEQTN